MSRAWIVAYSGVFIVRASLGVDEPGLGEQKEGCEVRVRAEARPVRDAAGSLGTVVQGPDRALGRTEGQDEGRVGRRTQMAQGCECACRKVQEEVLLIAK